MFTTSLQKTQKGRQTKRYSGTYSMISTASGIYIPDTAKEKPQQGKVIAVGPGKKDEPMEVKAGDEVLYGKYAGTEVTVDDKKYLIVKESDILAIL